MVSEARISNIIAGVFMGSRVDGLINATTLSAALCLPFPKRPIALRD